MGNSGHMAFHMKSKKSDMTHTMCAIPSGIKDTYLFWGDLGNNAKVLDTCLKTLLCAPDTLDTAPVPPDIYERADRIAAPVPPGSGGVLFLPWFNGSISPGQDEYLRGGFINLSHSTGRSHMVRVGVRGPGHELALAARAGRETARAASSSTGASPAAGRSRMSGPRPWPTWSGIPMHRQANPRIHNVLGMGFLAFSRLGKLNLDDVPGMIKFDRVFEPDPKNKPIYDRMYAQFTAAREKIRPVFHALNKS